MMNVQCIPSEDYDDEIPIRRRSREDDCEFIKQCDTLIDKINRSAKEQKNEIRQLKKLYKKSLKEAIKVKKKEGKKKTGFTTDEIVPKDLAKLIGVEYGTKMPRTVLTSKVYNVLKERNLYYSGDKRVLRADDEIRHIFNLSKTVNESKDAKDEDGFNFFNIQKHIAKCYHHEKEMNKKNNLIVHNL
jgi:chromatin remodeling complex protein RSC6